MKTILLAFVVMCCALLSGFAAESSQGAVWTGLEAAATLYVAKASVETLQQLQEAVQKCVTNPLPDSEAKDATVSAAWKAVQEAVKPLSANPSDPERARFWAALQAYFWSKAWLSLRESAGRYVQIKAPGTGEAWAKKFKDKVETRAETTKLGFEEAAQSVILDWMTDYEKDLAAKQAAAILEACRIFCWARDNGIALPGLVLEGLQKENRMTKFAKYLDAEVTRKPETN